MLEQDKEIAGLTRFERLTEEKKAEFLKKLAVLRESRLQRNSVAQALVDPVSKPFYDEVYRQGMAWLDSL